MCILTTNSAHEAAGALGTRHSPRPRYFRGTRNSITSGRMSAREREAVSECRHGELASGLLTKIADHKNRPLQCVKTNVGQGVVKSILFASRWCCDTLDGARCALPTRNNQQQARRGEGGLPRLHRRADRQTCRRFFGIVELPAPLSMDAKARR